MKFRYRIFWTYLQFWTVAVFVTVLSSWCRVFVGHLGNFLFFIKKKSCGLQRFLVCLSVKLNLMMEFLGSVEFSFCSSLDLNCYASGSCVEKYMGKVRICARWMIQQGNKIKTEWVVVWVLRTMIFQLWGTRYCYFL